MQKTCKQCQQLFEITEKDLEFYDKISPVFEGIKYPIPAPTLCDSCRQQRKLAFRNERHLYHRKCDLTGKPILSIYSPDKPFKVYDTESWWGDKWDGLDYGRDFDFSRPFFDQFKDLLLEVPTLSIMNVDCENSEYTNHGYQNKNCYMTFATDLSEDCYYTDYSFSCKNCVDNFALQDCELCYECINCIKCYNTFFSQDCSNCRDSYFCSFCKNCSNCFGCMGLRNKEYCIYNQQVTKEEWESKIKSLVLTKEIIEQCRKNALQEKLKYPHPHAVMTNCENCTGDYLSNCKNAINCFDSAGIEDGKNCVLVPIDAKNFYDVAGGGKCELLYESYSAICNNGKFLGWCWSGNSDLMYCLLCMNSSHDLFGCIGLKHKNYCILNKQYTKEGYDKLVPKIIEHMKMTGEWGEFFPIQVSHFCYNETVANDDYPMSREEVLKKGWKWYDEIENNKQYIGPKYEIKENIKDVSDEIIKNILVCSVTGKPYKIIKQELDFYRRANLPIPAKCPTERYKARKLLRNPRKLWARECDNCRKSIQTSYAPDRPEKIYCETCYLDTVY